MSKWVIKVWGHEEVVVANPLYTLKRMLLLPELQCSVHYHNRKTETFVVESGVLALETFEPLMVHGLVALTPTGDPTYDVDARPNLHILSPTEQFTIPPLMAHRFYCAGHQPCSFLEVSTEDLPEDSIRLTESGPRPRSRP